jgi:hypothetical protein
LTLKVEVLFSTSTNPSIEGKASTDMNRHCSHSENLKCLNFARPCGNE